jgi:hypothetical protein
MYTVECCMWWRDGVASVCVWWLVWGEIVVCGGEIVWQAWLCYGMCEERVLCVMASVRRDCCVWWRDRVASLIVWWQVWGESVLWYGKCEERVFCDMASVRRECCVWWQVWGESVVWHVECVMRECCVWWQVWGESVVCDGKCEERVLCVLASVRRECCSVMASVGCGVCEERVRSVCDNSWAITNPLLDISIQELRRANTSLSLFIKD